MLTSFHVGKCLGFVHIFYIFMFLCMYFILYIHHSVTLTSENPFFFSFFFGLNFCRILAYVLNGWSHGSKYTWTLYIYTQINKNIFTDTSVYMLDKIRSFAVDLVLTIFIIQNVLINAQWEQTGC